MVTPLAFNPAISMAKLTSYRRDLGQTGRSSDRKFCRKLHGDLDYELDWGLGPKRWASSHTVAASLLRDPSLGQGCHQGHLHPSTAQNNFPVTASLKATNLLLKAGL
jgi:hypothetical protein